MNQKVDWVLRKIFGGKRETRRCTKRYVQKSLDDDEYLEKRVGFWRDLK